MARPHRILLLGATGATGREILSQALEQGHTVTALARRPERLEMAHPQLTTVAADLAADADAMVRALPGHDVVLSALGRGQSLRSQNLLARATPGIVSAMERQRVQRLVFLSAFGVGGTAPQAHWRFRLMFRLMLADLYADKAVAEKLLRQSTLDWTVLAPVLLSDGPATGRYRVGEHLPVRGVARIARADVAAAVLQCIDDTTTVWKRCIVAP